MKRPRLCDLIPVSNRITDTSWNTASCGDTSHQQIGRLGWLVVAILLSSRCVTAVGDLQVDTQFPSASGRVVLIDQSQRLVKLSPKEIPGRGWVCWWYVKLTGIEPGTTIQLQVGNAPWATPLRAAFSTDERSWVQTAPGQRQAETMVYRHRVDVETAWFAWGPPFTVADAHQLVDRSALKLPPDSSFILCTTRGGNQVPALRIPCSRPNERPLGIWVQARQHAWESGSSWVCSGLVKWLLSDSPRAGLLRQRASVTVVPVMDVDSVLEGTGGKDQAPHDHNRDWGEHPHWPAVKHAMKQIRALDQQNQLDLFVDLHNPGPTAQHPFFFVTPRRLLTETAQRNLDHFLRVAQFEMRGPLTFRGETKESGQNYDKHWKMISKNWVSQNTSPHVVSLTLETAWNTPHSTIEGYETVGRQLGMSIERYLRTSPRNFGVR